MTPNDLLHRCGFVRTSDTVRQTNPPTIFGSRDVWRFRPVWGAGVAEVEVKVATSEGRTNYEAMISGVEGGPFVLETGDPRDLAVLAAALQDPGRPEESDDASVRMVGPDGPVANPFASGDGTWSFSIGEDGRRHLDDPASRWGEAYASHKEVLTHRYEGMPHQAEPLEYLEAAGFVRGNGALRLVLHPMDGFDGEAEETRRTTLELTVIDADVGGLPDVGTMHFEVRAVATDKDILDVVYRSQDVRDVLAFVDAAGNVIVAGHGYAMPEGRSFGHAWSGMAIHNPFGEASYGDWNVVEKTDGQIVVADPWIVWGHEYFAWRDERSASVLSSASPGAQGTAPRA